MATLLMMNVNWDVHPEIEEARRLLERYMNTGDKDLIINSANDSQHSAGSLHPSGKAFDIRKDNTLSKPRILNTIGKGNPEEAEKNFDVVSYSWGYHIEYQPK